LLQFSAVPSQKEFVAAILGSILLAFIVLRQTMDDGTDNDDGSDLDAGGDFLYYDAAGVRWAICAGIAVGVAEMLSFFVSSLGVQAMQSIPTIIGGSVFFGCLLGFVLLHEVLSLTGWVGVAMICAGISLVGLDPAATAAH
jgi:drug/metabolite transporter (DMT)-like permease